jgi:hypothetical protein
VHIHGGSKEVSGMSIEWRNLYQIAIGGPFSMWHYHTKDEFGAILEHGYWDGCSNMFKVNDMLVVRSHGENSILFVTEVVKSTPGSVRVSLLQSAAA